MSTSTKAEMLKAATRYAKAMSHALRVECWTILNERVASPNEMSEELGESLTDVAYHVRVLEKYDCIELVDTAQRRGATEHYYRATRRSLISVEDWAQVPEPIKGPLGDRFIQGIINDYEEARAADTATRDGYFHISRTPLRLDQEGLERVVGLLDEVRDAIAGEEAASLERLGDEKALPVSLGLSMFRMP